MKTIELTTATIEIQQSENAIATKVWEKSRRLVWSIACFSAAIIIGWFILQVFSESDTSTGMLAGMLAPMFLIWQSMKQFYGFILDILSP